MKKFSSLWRMGAAVGLAALPHAALAQTNNPFIQAQNLATEVGSGAGLNTQNTSLTGMVGRIINIVLGFLGIVLLGYLLFAGYKWMTAGGDSKQVDEAKAMIKNAIIGLIVIVAAFAISTFVLGSLVNATSQ